MAKKTQKSILFLGYDRSQTKLIDKLESRGCAVTHRSDQLTSTEYDLIVSFGYQHILKAETLAKIRCPILNLHISYLPYNRGAHPNFWAFYDGTPAGVTIHLIDEGLDTGPILYQKRVSFSPNEKTFVQTYDRLISEIETLFIKHIDEIIQESWVLKEQKGAGTLHRLKDLPDGFSGWDSDIEHEIKRLKSQHQGSAK